MQENAETAKKVTIVNLHHVCTLKFSEVNNRSIYLKFLFTLREHDQLFEVLMNRNGRGKCVGEH